MPYNGALPATKVLEGVGNFFSKKFLTNKPFDKSKFEDKLGVSGVFALAL